MPRYVARSRRPDDSSDWRFLRDGPPTTTAAAVKKVRSPRRWGRFGFFLTGAKFFSVALTFKKYAQIADLGKRLPFFIFVLNRQRRENLCQHHYSPH